MQCHINLCRKKKINKAECKVNPPLHQPHGLVITERMCTLHVAVFADKFSKCANLIHSQEQQGGLHSPIVFADHTMRGNRYPNIFSPRVQYPLFCYGNRSKLHGYIWSPSFRQRIFKHRCPRKERNSEQSISTGML